MKIRFAITPPASALREESFSDYLVACEHLGFDTLWLSDIPLGPLGDPLVSLTYAAGRTTRLKLGANIVPLGRNPLWLAKQLAQLDRLSGGRLLLSLVPGLGSAAERAALGHATGDRGAAIDRTIALLRQWWAGDAVTGNVESFRFDNLKIEPTPLQQPLEIWLGGIGPAALSRVARLADGWLTAAATPREAADGRAAISREALQLGRVIDAEHFGISIPFAQVEPPESALAGLRQRRADRDLSEIVTVDRAALQSLVSRHIDGGLSKFVLRSLGTGHAWREELEWLADTVLALQT